MLRFAVVVYLGFTNGEYHIALVDFIGSSRGRLERDRGFSIPYPSPTPLLTPEVSAAADTPRVDEVESRGWGRRAPQSPSSPSFGAPQGNNEIYTYDVVFPHW